MTFKAIQHSLITKVLLSNLPIQIKRVYKSYGLGNCCMEVDSSLEDKLQRSFVMDMWYDNTTRSEYCLTL